MTPLGTTQPLEPRNSFPICAALALVTALGGGGNGAHVAAFSQRDTSWGFFWHSVADDLFLSVEVVCAARNDPLDSFHTHVFSRPSETQHSLSPC